MPRSKFAALLERLASINPGQGQQMPWREFLHVVGARRYTARLAVDLGKPNVVRRIVLDDLPVVARVGRRVSKYPRLAFVETEVSGRTLARWLQERNGHAAGVGFEVPEPHDAGNCERHPSHSTYLGVRVPWPVLRFSLAPREGQVHHPEVGLVMSQGLPTFPTYLEALAHYLYPSEQLDVNAVPDGLVVVRTADARCWIDHMHFAATHVKLALRGSEVVGTHPDREPPR